MGRSLCRTVHLGSWVEALGLVEFSQLIRAELDGGQERSLRIEMQGSQLTFLLLPKSGAGLCETDFTLARALVGSAASANGDTR